MKVKTSVTLSEELVQELDRREGEFGNRSQLIERAIRAFLAAESRRERDASDLEIINRRAEALNAESADVLGYQVES